MLTPQDVRSVQFEKNLRGYRTEEVDRFLDKVEEQLTQSENEAEALRKQIADLTAENQKLRQEMKDYEADGDMLKSALINAQRMGENVIREANQKSEEILHRANLRGDDIIRDANELLQKASDRADEIINEANEKKLAQEREYDRVRLEVTRFKSDVLNLYRSHVESLSRLPEFQKEEPAEDAPAEDEAAAADTTAAAVTEEIAEAQPAAADVDAEDEAPADEKTSITQEVRNPQLQSFVINGWGADYGDPVNFVGQEILHDDNAYYSWYYSNIAKVVEAGPADWQKDLVACYEEFTDLVNTAKAIVDDTDARYAAFAKAEASMLNSVLACPCNFDVSWTLTHANEYSKINAMYGPCNYKAVNWETSEEAYTTEQYDEFAAAFDAATQA